MGTLHWDLFCRVVDNFGDIGVCWRLAAQLAARGDRVRLVVDDASTLAWMAPSGAPGVEVLPWPGPVTLGDVVVEAFGCHPPPDFVAAMSAAPVPPVWVNLEHLSAEAYVERSHGLPSPQPGGLTKWFFYPGFTARTGGLLREDGLAQARAGFDRRAWLASIGAAPRAGERVVSLFCYANPACAALLADLARLPTLLLLTPGPAQQQVQALGALPAGLRLHRLPWLDQTAYDRLLWSCELNFVRGEDSLVRALWAGAPLVWQAYPQHDGAHRAKLEALLALLEEAALPAPVATLWRAWNGFAPWPGLPADDIQAGWRSAAERFADSLRAQAAQADLAGQLRQFVLAKASASMGGAAPATPP